MQKLQWFPGHMAKAVRMMEDNIKLVDAVIIILDSRAYKSCMNPTFTRLFENKKVLYVLNKSDLVEEKDIMRIKKELKSEGKESVSIVGTEKKATKKLVDAIFLALEEKVERAKAKGIYRPMRVMVAGIPNTGKSTIINTICGKKKAETGDKAGVTRSKQWIRLDGLELLDTPGTMPPFFENQEYAKRLAYIGSINDDILDFEDLLLEFLKEISQKYPIMLKNKYNLTNLELRPLELYEEICRNRGYILKGQEYDYSRCAKAVFNDFRNGRIGKICLD